MFGNLLRCLVCHQYAPDRCTCGKPLPVAPQFQLGNLVCSNHPMYPLRSGGQEYERAVVSCVNPLVLVSEQADMRWKSTVLPETLIVCGQVTPDQLALCQTRLDGNERQSCGLAPI